MNPISLITSAFNFIWGGTQVALKWIGLYGGAKQIEAREISFEQKLIDDFKKAQAAGDIRSVRNKLSDPPPN